MSNRIKNILMPGVVLPLAAGGVTGCLIFIFKLAAGYVVQASERIYALVRANALYLPLLLIGALAVGAIAVILLKYEKNAAGGGISTSVAVVRGLLTFKWLRTLITVFFAALLTYFGGVPLGNEGPSVQMGTAVGEGTVSLLAKNRSIWRRYVMTGSASAGFAAATGAPLSGIIFSAEELHERITPTLMLSAVSAVGASFGVTELLCFLTSGSSSLFHISIKSALPFKFVWMAAVVGIACALVCVLYTKSHTLFGKLISKADGSVLARIKVLLVFLATAVTGFFFSQCVGSGHDLIESVLEGSGVWYMLTVFLLLRMLLMLTANNFGVTGGLFVPNLTFGALIGILCAKGFNAIGALPSEYNVIMVCVAMSAYLCANSRIPFTAAVFGLEALCGFSNILAVIVAVACSYIAVRLINVKTCDEVSIERREMMLDAADNGKSVKCSYTVMPDSFASGRYACDILLPYGCELVSPKKGRFTANESVKLVCKQSALSCLEDIFGKQSECESTVA